MFRSVSLRRFCLPPLAAVVLLCLAGCTDDSRQSYATETDEPYYRQAEQMKRSSRHQEALLAYLKVIEKRGDDAPESHLETGLIYLHHIRDPIGAIYHFRKYLALRPNSAQAPLVRQRIDAAIRDFARTLPAQPIENQLQRVDFLAAMDKLKLENDILKQQLSDYQSGRAVTGAEGEPGGNASTPAIRDANEFRISVDTLPTVRTRASSTRSQPAPPEQPKTAPSRAATAAETKTAPAATRGGARRHIVQKGDTLSKLSQHYFGNRTRWRDIYQANRNVMKNDSDLKVGMELVIPQ
ncbi:MAG: LysM peptidoglycan-binding domain-containing protein [Candidatus Didemnitutus sp.]|nr:LysM peptidoglycan-binding domain-containing protein [Candidatus Didemnitutus sp.]